MSQAKKTVEIFYDIVSPYSWIGFEILCRLRQKWAIDIKFQPYLFGGLLKETGIEAPNFNTRKFLYYAKDLQRLKSHYNVGLFDAFPEGDALKFRQTLRKGSLPAMRVITAINQDMPDKTEAISREFWLRLYGTGEDILESNSLVETCERAGLSAADAEKMVARSKDYDIKIKLKEVTQRLIELGGFGAPMILAPDKKGEIQMLWGSDRFEILAEILGEKFDRTQIRTAKL